jgi:glyoxylase-like metal-dependent hydrolase (beta-lactamase superfamily II)/rhodanese-related sulfurtransferase
MWLHYDAAMILKQYYLGCLSHASYLIGDEKTGSAVIVDPQRDVDAYVKDAQAQGLTIKDVVLTHFHADFVAGHLELQKRTGAPISLGAAAHPGYAFKPRHEGDTIQYGDTKLQVLETPGHTPEAISLLAYDTAKDPNKPQAVLTGDTLFVGDVGRPDLMASEGVTAKELAGELYDSLHDKLMKLPDETVVYPAHGPGSLCGSGHTTDTKSTIGQEKATNFALQPMSRDQFVDMLTAHLPEAPAYFGRDAQLNKIERPTLDTVVATESQALPLDKVRQMEHDGAQILDVRDPDQFASGHLQNSINIGLDGRFASWAGQLLDPRQPIVVVAESGREAEAIMRLGRVGFDNVAGYLDGGPRAWASSPECVSQTQRIEPAQLALELVSPTPPMVLDVRGADEFNEGHIAGAVNIPLSHLQARGAEVPRARPVVVHCQSGYRSSMAVSLLERQAPGMFTDLHGGIAAWVAAGLPVTR